MPDAALRLRGLWLFLGWGLVMVVIYLSLTSSPPTPLTFNNADKLEHLLAYGMLQGWFMQIYNGRARALTAALLVGMGVVLELLQGMGGVRQYDLTDAAANSLGILLAWALLRPPLDRIFLTLEQRMLG